MWIALAPPCPPSLAGAPGWGSSDPLGGGGPLVGALAPHATPTLCLLSLSAAALSVAPAGIAASL